MVLFDTPLHVDALTDESKLLWHKHLKRQYSKNSQPSNPPASLSPAVDNMKVVKELMAGLRAAPIWELQQHKQQNCCIELHCHSLFIFLLALQPIVVCILQPSSGL